jgi:hypothetical protein
MARCAVADMELTRDSDAMCGLMEAATADASKCVVAPATPETAGSDAAAQVVEGSAAATDAEARAGLVDDGLKLVVVAGAAAVVALAAVCCCVCVRRRRAKKKTGYGMIPMGGEKGGLLSKARE